MPTQAKTKASIGRYLLRMLDEGKLQKPGHCLYKSEEKKPCIIGALLSAATHKAIAAKSHLGANETEINKLQRDHGIDVRKDIAPLTLHEARKLQTSFDNRLDVAEIRQAITKICSL